MEDFEKGMVISDKEPTIVRQNDSTALVEGIYLLLKVQESVKLLRLTYSVCRILYRQQSDWFRRWQVCNESGD